MVEWTSEDGKMSIRKLANKAKVSGESVRKYNEEIVG